MCKSQVSALLHVMSGVFKDIQAVYPALKGFPQDIERTALYANSRGLGFFSLDLPCLDTLLLRGLETGRLQLEGPLTKMVSKRVRVPRLFSGLWLRVFERDASLKLEPDVNAIFFLRQIFCLGKKVEVEPTKERREATLTKYYDVEASLRHPSLNWDEDKLIGRKDASKLHFGDCVRQSLPLFEHIEGENLTNDQRLAQYRLLRTVQQTADLVVDNIGWMFPEEYSSELEASGYGIGFRHGPGAVSERLKNHEKSGFPNWPDKLEGWFPYATCGKTAGAETERPSNHEVPSRLLCVPKTAKGPRLIAAEPTAHQWCQQLVWRFLEERLMQLFQGAFVNFRKQSASGDLVLQSSKDRKLATVDLSDASDRLTCWTVERMFRKNYPLLCVLHAARTRYLRDDNHSDGSNFLILRKFASQGTAVTFPIQSICFLIIAISACIDGEVTMSKIWKLSRQVRVYGDDIIIPSHGYTRLCEIMELLELKVNKDKSYVHGHFRESCGVDGYMGYDVTPVKPRRVVAGGPESWQAIVDTSNNLFNKGLWNAAICLESHLPVHVQRGLRIVRRPQGSLSFERGRILDSHDTGYGTGFTSYVGGDERHLKKRWNRRLHRHEVRVLSFSERTREKQTRSGWSPLLDFFASPYNSEHARIVSEGSAINVRRARAHLAWEPSNTLTQLHNRPPSL